jgi:hypothetical protein
MALRVSVDFNTMMADEKERVSINTLVNPALLEYLSPGLQLVLYESESMEVDAVAEFDEERQRWFGIPNWSTRRDLPPLTGRL